MGAFLATLVVIPIWATTLLPFTICWQIGKMVLKPLLKKPEAGQLDSGYKVSASDIVPREDRKYDVVVLGATGFTGGLAVRHLAKTYGVNNTVKWAIAGRTESKLKKVLKDLADELGIQDLTNVDIIVVDTMNPSTLPKLVAQTRVVATTAGPYTLYGNHVVEFCAKFGTHYADITGELDWVRNMYLHWQDTAKQTGARLISFCGHDSIPWDMSVMKVQEILAAECKDRLTEINFWDEAIGGAPGGTIATLYTILDGTAIKSPKVNVDPFQRLPDGTKSDFRSELDLPLFIKKCHSPWDDKSSSRWIMPFIMASVNGGVVKWSHALRADGSQHLTYRESAVCSDFKSAFTMFFGLGIFASTLFNPITKPLIQNYVLPKSGDGPPLDKMEKKHFLCVSSEGIGENGNRVLSHMYLPKDAGCLETSRMLVESALCLALAESDLPAKQGGFWTPSTALGNVLMQRLEKTGTEFTYAIVPKSK